MRNTSIVEISVTSVPEKTPVKEYRLRPDEYSYATTRIGIDVHNFMDGNFLLYKHESVKSQYSDLY